MSGKVCININIHFRVACPDQPGQKWCHAKGNGKDWKICMNQIASGCFVRFHLEKKILVKFLKSMAMKTILKLMCTLFIFVY